MIDPAAEPRPGPTAMPLSLDQFTRSATIRKYDSYFIFSITPSSYSIRSSTDASRSFPYRRSAPSATSFRRYSRSLSFASGTSNLGRMILPSSSSRLHRSAIRAVLARASASSGSSLAICSPVFIEKSSPVMFIRLVSSISLPVWMQSRTSCGSASSGST